MIKYKTLFGMIEKVEIERETEHQVVLKSGRKEHKETNWYTYFDTWEEAHKSLVFKAENDIYGAILRLDEAKAKLDKIKKMVSF